LPKKTNIPTQNKQNKNVVLSKKVVVKKNTAPNIAGKIITKPSPNTKSFLS
jgi:hypothetical protein